MVLIAKDNVAIVLNILLIVLEIIALAITIDLIGLDLTYYTVDANLFALISAILFLTLKKRIPKAVDILKYSSTLALLITFLVVIFILYPMRDFNFNFLFLEGPNLYFHVLCPLIVLISFLLFENNELENTLKNNLYAMLFTLIYAVIIISLNIAKVVTGPYPFLMVYSQPLLASLFWVIVILGFAFVLARLLLMIKDLLTILNV